MSTPREDALPGPIGNRRLFWVCAGAGWVLIVIGIRGVIIDARFTRPPQWSLWFVGAALFHDLVVAPLVFAVAVGLLRRLRRPYRALVQAALALTTLILAVSLPVVLRPGKPAGNPTVLSNDAGAPLMLLLGATWAITGFAFVRAESRARKLPND